MVMDVELEVDVVVVGLLRVTEVDVTVVEDVVDVWVTVGVELVIEMDVVIDVVVNIEVAMVVVVQSATEQVGNSTSFR
jgi:hypothetical protein